MNNIFEKKKYFSKLKSRITLINRSAETYFQVQKVKAHLKGSETLL